MDPVDSVEAAVLGRARHVARAYGAHTGVDVDAATLLAGRAAMLGLPRAGRVSAGGASRLFPARDGWCALTLSRPDDVDAVPALVESASAPSDPWVAVESWAAAHRAAEFAERARLLGLPVAVLGEFDGAAVVDRPLGVPTGPRAVSGLLVVDLSSMWAGPLCAQLLARAGATVVKVETRARPDGTRAGPVEFFNWVNSGKLSYAADFAEQTTLRALLSVADVVIESSRPESLRRRGLGPDDVAARPGRVWLRITGHGTRGERANWVAFGDDAAVAGGLVGEGPVFCGDAIADPLTGLQAALSIVEALERGGGRLVELAMAGVAAEYAGLPPVSNESDWAATVSPMVIPAAALGEHNTEVERLIAQRSTVPC